jgi:hypothetical protein
VAVLGVSERVHPVPYAVVPVGVLVCVHPRLLGCYECPYKQSQQAVVAVLGLISPSQGLLFVVCWGCCERYIHPHSEAPGAVPSARGGGSDRMSQRAHFMPYAVVPVCGRVCQLLALMR